MAIGFDLDGTLVDSLDLTAQWMTRAATIALGNPVSEALVRGHFGKPEPEIFRELLKDGPADEAFAHYQEILSRECRQMRLYPQVTETLSSLQERQVPLAIFTSRGTWATGKLLGALGLRDFFSLVLTGEDVRKVKPDPEGILMMCAHFRIAPEKFLYIGDSPADVQAAENAGAVGYQCLWANGVQPYGSRHLRSFEEIKALLS